MRTLAYAMALAALIGAPALAQNAAAPAAAPAAPAAAACPGNPNAIGVARVVEIDTTGGPGFGSEHFKAYDFLRDREVILTFDDGPWPGHTEMVLKALADHCAKAVFFPIGKHAGYYPSLMKQVAAAGHTVGSHTWSHRDLTAKTLDEAKEDIEKGVSAVSIALGTPIAPFVRFPALRHPPEVVKYVGGRNMGIFSTDLDSFDFKARKPEQVINTLMSKLEKRGKGILLMHDFQQATAHAVPELLNKLKAGGYKIVQVRGKEPLKSLPEYDQIVQKEIGGGMENARPMSSVIKDVTQ